MTNQKRALFAAMSGYALDGFDLLMLGFILTPLATALHLTTAQSGSLVTWTLIGGALGGSVFGIAGDYFGRARVLSISILVFSFFTFLCAFSVGFKDLFIYRFCAGIGLGCEFGVGMTLATEAYPREKRARIASYVGMSWQFGVLFAALLTPFLLPYVGWRGMFIIGGLPAVASFMIRRTVPESQAFAEVKETGIPHFPLKALFHTVESTKRSLAILILSTVQNFGYYGIIIWVPSYLMKVYHFTLNVSGIWTAVSVCGMILGVWAFGEIADRIGRKPTFLIYQVGAIVTVLLYTMLRTPTELLVGGFVSGIFINGMMGGYGALITDLFPTYARSTAQNVIWSVGRALGGFGPMFFGALLVYMSFDTALKVLSGIYIIDLITTIFLIPRNSDAQNADPD
ncbi:MFS transporter [Novacetimonas hansenii]|uniref:MFS transporter n=1 Tax=Novacetimonas hansenii TaxID=436 RepID=UPI001780E218|nr:MFS transporter [Novacetimonas hansenii]QOF94089.1 MFS transporter [Novacetimonas hansenii]